MKTSKLSKMVARDVDEWALAQMFFGDGAGTRRKLVGAAVEQKMADIPGYAEAFETAFANLNQIEYAERALAERKRIDRAAKAGKNLRALKSGNLSRLSNGLFIVVGTAYVLHVTGYDKILEAKIKRAYADLKVRIEHNKVGDNRYRFDG